MYVFLGAVPGPESMLFSAPPQVPLASVSTKVLLESFSPTEVEEQRRICQSNMQCVHDALASGIADLGQSTLDAKTQFEKLALIYGKQHSQSFLCFYH